MLEQMLRIAFTPFLAACIKPETGRYPFPLSSLRLCLSEKSLLLYYVYSLSLQVALKTLIVIHRLLREGDPTFREELLNFSQRGRILQLSNFKDDSSPIGEC